MDFCGYMANSEYSVGVRDVLWVTNFSEFPFQLNVASFARAHNISSTHVVGRAFPKKTLIWFNFIKIKVRKTIYFGIFFVLFESLLKKIMRFVRTILFLSAENDTFQSSTEQAEDLNSRSQMRVILLVFLWDVSELSWEFFLSVLLTVLSV